MKSYRSVREVLGDVEQLLTPKPRLIPRGHMPVSQIRGAHFIESPLQEVLNRLQSGRHYFAVTLYLEAGGRLLRQASTGPAPRCDSMRLGEGNVGQAAKTGTAKLVPDVRRDPQYVKVFEETRSELVMPIKIAAHVVGVIDAESDRENAFAYEDRVLLEKIAKMLARFLSSHGQYLVMKAREAATANPLAPAKAPQSSGAAARAEVARAGTGVQRPGRLVAAAGEKARS